MAIFYDAPVTPDDITEFTREVPIPRTNAFLNAFGRKTSDDNTIDWATITKTNRTARYRSLDGRIHVSERDSGSKARVALLPLSTSLNQSEYETLQLQFARLQGGNTAALATAIYNDAETLTEQVLNRLEQAWGDVLSDGKLTINENGFQGEADFGVPANQKVAPATLWSNTAASTPITDLVSWSDAYAANNGQALPGAIRVTLATQRLLQRNTQIINAAYGASAGRTFATIPDLNAVLSDQGLPPISLLSIASFDIDGTTTPVMPSNLALLTPENIGDLGSTYYGVSATALELVNSSQSDLTFERAAGVVGIIEKSGPPYRQFTFVDATAMPVLENASLLMIATVA